MPELLTLVVYPRTGWLWQRALCLKENPKLKDLENYGRPQFYLMYCEFKYVRIDTVSLNEPNIHAVLDNEAFVAYKNIPLYYITELDSLTFIRPDDSKIILQPLPEHLTTNNGSENMPDRKPSRAVLRQMKRFQELNR